MDIILVSGRLPSSKVITLRGSHIAGGFLAILLLLFALAALMNYATLRYAAETRDPRVFSLFSEAARDHGAGSNVYLRDNLDAMATRLGELQAQVLRLDTLSERVARLAGFRPQDLAGEAAAASGPSLTPPIPVEPLSFTQLARRLDMVARLVEERSDRLGLIDTVLAMGNVRKQLVPSAAPIAAAVASSDFGVRPDPFHGQASMHEGIDFTAPVGTGVVAAAAGVVVVSEYHHQYGNMVEIDHGSGLITRYAHCSRLLVKVGDVVRKGATIAEVGSSGRATGPHLHFEVRQNGVAQNPTRFLRTTG